MKVFIALCVLIAYVSAADWTAKTQREMRALGKECLKVPENLVTEGKQLVEEKLYRCYYRCIGEKAGIWDDEKGINVDRMTEQISKAARIVNKEDLLKCIEQNDQKSDKCTWSYRQFNCIRENYLRIPIVA